jgi:hypothetical protein
MRLGLRPTHRYNIDEVSSLLMEQHPVKFTLADHDNGFARQLIHAK